MSSKESITEFIPSFPTSLEVMSNKELAPDSIAHETGLIPVRYLLGPISQDSVVIGKRVWIGPKVESDLIDVEAKI